MPHYGIYIAWSWGHNKQKWELTKMGSTLLPAQPTVYFYMMWRRCKWQGENDEPEHCIADKWDKTSRDLSWNTSLWLYLAVKVLFLHLPLLGGYLIAVSRTRTCLAVQTLVEIWAF